MLISNQKNFDLFRVLLALQESFIGTFYSKKKLCNMVELGFNAPNVNLMKLLRTAYLLLHMKLNM